MKTYLKQLTVSSSETLRQLVPSGWTGKSGKKLLLTQDCLFCPEGEKITWDMAGFLKEWVWRKQTLWNPIRKEENEISQYSFLTQMYCVTYIFVVHHHHFLTYIASLSFACFLAHFLDFWLRLRKATFPSINCGNCCISIWHCHNEFVSFDTYKKWCYDKWKQFFVLKWIVCTQ